jgi:hypothetical protein
MSYILFNQYDPKWAKMKIGKSDMTMGRQGCASSSLCMAFSDSGYPISPDEASSLDWYNDAGLVVWDKVAKWFKKEHPHNEISIKRYYGRNDGAIRQNLSPGHSVLLQVANASHWMKGQRKSLIRNDYICSDPWGGVNRTATGDYGNITGYVIMSIK